MPRTSLAGGRTLGTHLAAFPSGDGPQTLSLSPRVDDPAFRTKTFDEVYDAYAEQVRGLRDGGADLLLVETIFDTLNAKAALFAIETVFDDIGARAPVMKACRSPRRTRTWRASAAAWPAASGWDSSQLSSSFTFSLFVFCVLPARERRYDASVADPEPGQSGANAADFLPFLPDSIATRTESVMPPPCQ